MDTIKEGWNCWKKTSEDGVKLLEKTLGWEGTRPRKDFRIDNAAWIGLEQKTESRGRKKEGVDWAHRKHSHGAIWEEVPEKIFRGYARKVCKEKSTIGTVSEWEGEWKKIRAEMKKKPEARWGGLAYGGSTMVGKNWKRKKKGNQLVQQVMGGFTQKQIPVCDKGCDRPSKQVGAYMWKSDTTQIRVRKEGKSRQSLKTLKKGNS